jgi:hypothetical protein
VLIPYDRGDLVSRLHIASRIISLEYVAEGTSVVAFVRPELAAELRQFCGCQRLSEPNASVRRAARQQSAWL